MKESESFPRSILQQLLRELLAVGHATKLCALRLELFFQQFDELLARANTPGISVAVIHSFAVHWTRGYGVADAATGHRVDERTRFQAASISKPVTALAVMRLVQDGKLALDDDINRTLRSWHVPDSEFTRTPKVTRRSLLSHTSGADDGLGFSGYDPGAPRPMLVQISKGDGPTNVRAVTFARAPYARFKYSGGWT
jgi:CubicO group peptidase (beta-lactamase class C family)